MEKHTSRFTKLSAVVLNNTILALSFGTAFFTTIVLDGGCSGYGQFIRTALVVCVFSYLILRERLKLPRDFYIYLAATVVLSLLSLFRLSDVLLFVNSWAILHLTLLAALRASSNIPFQAADYIMTAPAFPFIATSSFRKLRTAKEQNRQRRLNQKQRQILRGVAWAAPLIIIFGALFASADAVFANAIENVFSAFSIDIDFDGKLVAQIIFGAILGLLMSSVLARLFVHRFDPKVSPLEAIKNIHLELSIVLGSLNVLFLMFIAIQAVYLFGGADTVLSGDLTYAEYGRSGFFELVAVSSIVFLLAYNLFRYVAHKEGRTNRTLLFALIAQVGVVMVSALRRLGLYEDVFGFTELRFYSHSFIFFLAAIFGLLIWSLAKREEHWQLLSKIVIAGVGYLLVLNIVNPDAFIARQNLDRFRDTGKIDVAYINNLSQDALDTKLILRNEVNAEDRESIERNLCNWLENDFERDYDGWRAWNAAAENAATIIDGSVDCEPYKPVDDTTESSRFN